MTSLLDDQIDVNKDIDPSKNYFEELVGESKKFKDTEALAKGKYLGDIHNKILEKTLDDLRAEYVKVVEENKTKAKLEDLIGRLADEKQLASNEQTEVKEVREQPRFDAKQLESLVDSRIQEREVSQRQQSNFNTVKAKLTERFGANYSEVVKEKMDSLGLTKDDIDSLSRKSPEAFFNVLGLNAQPAESFQTPPRSSTGSFRPTGGSKARTYSYYKELRKADPALYSKPHINIQMDKDAQELGEAFFDVD